MSDQPKTKKLLNLGCGNRFHSDWINIDLHTKHPSIVAHDLRKGIPFEDESIDFVYHSHVLEHFSKNDGVSFLRECARVLKRGGVMRICVPDLESIARAYLTELENARSGKKNAEKNHEWMTIELIDQLTRHQSGGEASNYLSKKEILNEDFVYRRVGEEARNLRKNILRQSTSSLARRKDVKILIRNVLKSIIPRRFQEYIKVGRFRLGGEVHQWMYDSYSLTALLSSIGLNEITVRTATESAMKEWRNYGLDTLESGLIIKPDSLFIEATKYEIKK